MTITRRALGFSFAAGLLAAVQPVSAQSGFNGTITFRTRSQDGAEGTLVQTTNGNKTRLDVDRAGSTNGSQSATSIIVDGSTHTMTVVSPAKKSYMQIDQEMVKRMQDMIGSLPRARIDSEAKAADLHIAKTGRTEVVAGVKCDVYHGTGIHDGTTKEGDVCVADGVGFAPFDVFGGMMGQRAQSVPQLAQLRNALGKNRGILKVTTYDGGKALVELEATAIDRTPPSGAAFLPPADYKKTELPAMFGRPPRP